MRFCCHWKRTNQFASTLLFWSYIFDCPHFKMFENDRVVRCDISWIQWPCYKHTRLWYFLVMLFILMRFWLFSTVHTHTIHMWICFAPLLRCIFQTDAFSMETLSILVWTEGLNLSKCKHFQRKTHKCGRGLHLRNKCKVRKINIFYNKAQFPECCLAPS